jgi:hypothetical protein
MVENLLVIIATLLVINVYYTVEHAKRIENRLDRLTAQLIQPGRPIL